MKCYNRYLTPQQIDDISTLTAIIEYYLNKDNRLKEDVKKRLLDVNLILEKMFDVKEEELESVSVKIEAYTKQDIEQIERLTK